MKTRGVDRRPLKVNPESNMLPRKDLAPNHLTAILTQRGPLSAESLWNVSQLDIDDFYDQLKEEEARGLLRENRSVDASSPRMLEPVA